MFEDSIIKEGIRQDLERGIIRVEGIGRKFFEIYFEPALDILQKRGVENPIIVFRCPGGDIELGFFMYDLIKSYPGDVIGIVDTTCSSMGVPVLQACTLKIVRPHANMTLHWGKSSFSMDEHEWLDRTRVDYQVARVQKNVDRYDDILLPHFTGSKADLHEMYRHSTSLVGEEIVKYGLADQVSDKPWSSFQS